MVFWVIHDVRNDIQKNSTIALPTDDFVFVFVPDEAACFLYEDIYAVNMSQRKTTEMSLEKLGLPKK